MDKTNNINITCMFPSKFLSVVWQIHDGLVLIMQVGTHVTLTHMIRPYRRRKDSKNNRKLPVHILYFIKHFPLHRLLVSIYVMFLGVLYLFRQPTTNMEAAPQSKIAFAIAREIATQYVPPVSPVLVADVPNQLANLRIAPLPARKNTDSKFHYPCNHIRASIRRHYTHIYIK